MQHILSENTLTVIMENGTPRSLHRGACGEEAWKHALQAVHNDDMTTIENILDKPRGINRYFESRGIEVRGGVLFYGEQELAGYAATKAIQFVEQGLPADALINFLMRVNKNPSYRAVQDLYKFLEFNNMPLTPSGCFMAYKKVRTITKTAATGEPWLDFHTKEPIKQLVDIHTGQICNDPGGYVSMARNKVDENPDRTCSHGLHVCSYEYLPEFGRGEGNTVVMVSVDPANVVAIPHDYHNAKMRVCAYEVVREIPEWRGHTWGSAVVEEHPSEDDEQEDDDVPGDDLNRARQERESSEVVSDADIQGLLQELDNWARDRLANLAHREASQRREPSPISTEMRVRYLLNHGYTLDQLRTRL